MTQSNPQVPWTDEQWARVNRVIQEEAQRARVAANFLPLYGPLSADTDFVREETIKLPPPGVRERLKIEDTKTIKLATLQVRVPVRGAQMADPELTSVLALFRRAANVLARIEDAVVFRGLVEDPNSAHHWIPGMSDLPPLIWDILGGEASDGLWPQHPDPPLPGPLWIPVQPRGRPPSLGQPLVQAVSDAIGRLERTGHFGPFAVVLGQRLFLIAQTPDSGSLVSPQDRIIPFLGGGPFLRSSTLLDTTGVVVALGGGPVELVVATDVSLAFLQVTEEPWYLFRVFEKMRLRIKEPDAIIKLFVPPVKARAAQPAQPVQPDQPAQPAQLAE